MSGAEQDPGALSRLLEELAQVPRPDVPDEYLSGLRPGTEVGRFIVEREIGRGGFGVVYSALDPELGRTVALKLLKPGSGLASKDGLWLRREAEAVARLSHAGIVTLHDFGRAPAGAFLVFELLRGETLSRRIGRGPVPLDEALGVAVAVARALAHAHEHDVLHRDLKPGNVFLCEGGAVKVLDFGIAHLFGQEGPTSGGTPAYMAPEQWRDEAVDARADLFALGVLLLETLTGKLPFGQQGARGAAVGQALEGLLPRSGAPRRLQRLIRALVQPDPAARPRSAREVADELEAIAAARREGWRAWRLVAVGGAVAALLALGAVWLLPGREAPAGEQVVAAVADVENATGDPDLDRLADLTRVALGESRRVRVLTRQRLLAAGRGTEAGEASRIDRRAGQVLAQLAGASVLLVPSVEPAGAGLAVSLSAEPPDGGKPLFVARAEAASAAGLPAALDEVVGETRRRLRERAEDLRSTPSGLAAMTTASLPAYRAYVEGLDCAARTSEWSANTSSSRCVDLFRRALGQDPGFALAHYQLSILLKQSGSAPDESAAHLGAALRAADRLSRRDAALVRAWKAHLDGRDEEALAAYAAVLAEHPDDLHVLSLAGELLFHKQDWNGAVPFLERMLGLDPEADWALEHLGESYAALRRLPDLRRLIDGLAARPPTPERLHTLVRAHVWAGEPEAALARARQAVELSGGLEARTALAAVLGLTMDPAAAEAVVRAMATERPGDPWTQVGLASRLVAQGRLREARAALAANASGLALLGPGWLPNARSGLLARDPTYRHLAEDAERLVRVDQNGAGAALACLALLGDPGTARTLAGHLPPDAPARIEVEAILAARAGDTVGALTSLLGLERRLPWRPGLLLPAYVVMEVAAAAGDATEVAAAGERLRRTWPQGQYWAWARGRALLLEATARAELGQLPEARHQLDLLLAAWRRADPDFAPAREARALRARLGPGPALPPGRAG